MKMVQSFDDFVVEVDLVLGAENGVVFDCFDPFASGLNPFEGFELLEDDGLTEAFPTEALAFPAEALAFPTEAFRLDKVM